MQKGLWIQGFQMCNVRAGSFCPSLVLHGMTRDDIEIWAQTSYKRDLYEKKPLWSTLNIHSACDSIPMFWDRSKIQKKPIGTTIVNLNILNDLKMSYRKVWMAVALLCSARRESNWTTAITSGHTAVLQSRSRNGRGNCPKVSWHQILRTHFTIHTKTSFVLTLLDSIW